MNLENIRIEIKRNEPTRSDDISEVWAVIAMLLSFAWIIAIGYVLTLVQYAQIFDTIFNEDTSLRHLRKDLNREIDVGYTDYHELNRRIKRLESAAQITTDTGESLDTNY